MHQWDRMPVPPRGVATSRNPLRLLEEAEREAEDLRLVLVVLRERDGEVHGQRDLAQERKNHPEARADARPQRVDLELLLDRAHVREDHATDAFAVQGEADLRGAGDGEISADGVLVPALAGADAAEFEPADRP